MAQAISNKITVLGSTGFIGRNIIDALILDGSYDVIGLSSKDIDLCNEESTTAKLPQFIKSSTVIIASAISLDRGDSIHGMIQNIQMYSNVASALKDTNPAHLIYLSSVEVYGRTGLDLPLNEFSQVKPSSFYGISKLAGEYIFRKVSVDNMVPYTILRLPRVYGSDDKHSVVSKFIMSALMDKIINVNSDGSQLRDFVYIKDVAELVKRIVQMRITGKYNLVTGRSRSINEILSIIKMICNPSLKIIYHRESTDYNLIFDKPAILKIISDFSFTDFERAIKETIQFYRRCADVEQNQRSY